MLDPTQHYSPRLMRLAFGSILIALVVLGLKLLAWWWTGSVALYSDALESGVNVATACGAFLALTYARRPADRTHPQGHMKAEYLSSVFEGALIAVAAVMIVWEAIAALVAPQPVDWPPLALLVSGLATSINAIWAQWLIRAGRAAKSPALEADGRHLWADVVTTLGVLIGIFATWLTGWGTLDAVIALAIAAHILWQGVHVIRESLAGLLDEAVEGRDLDRIKELIEKYAEGALQIHDVVTRRAGPVTFIEFHLIVEGTMTVRRSHTICDRIERGLRAEDPGMRVTIHVEPEEKAKADGTRIH